MYVWWKNRSCCNISSLISNPFILVKIEIIIEIKGDKTIFAYCLWWVTLFSRHYFSYYHCMKINKTCQIKTTMKKRISHSILKTASSNHSPCEQRSRCMCKSQWIEPREKTQTATQFYFVRTLDLNVLVFCQPRSQVL